MRADSLRQLTVPGGWQVFGLAMRERWEGDACGWADFLGWLAERAPRSSPRAEIPSLTATPTEIPAKRR